MNAFDTLTVGPPDASSNETLGPFGTNTEISAALGYSLRSSNTSFSTNSASPSSVITDTTGGTDVGVRLSPRTTLAPGPIIGMQKWEGRITEIDDDIFTAELIQADGAGPTLLAEFAVKHLGQDDAAVARPGDIVYVTVRTVQSVGHAPTLTSAVRLRRLGHWTIDEVEKIEDITRRRMSILADIAD